AEPHGFCGLLRSEALHFASLLNNTVIHRGATSNRETATCFNSFPGTPGANGETVETVVKPFRSLTTRFIAVLMRPQRGEIGVAPQSPADHQIGNAVAGLEQG